MSFETISFSDVPLVIKNCLNWNILKWTVDDWDAFLNKPSEKYPFRTGSFSCSAIPQWERSCQLTNMTFSDFFDKFKDNHNFKNWWYFDYKHIEEWLKGKSDKMDISWQEFGFPDKMAKDSTLWIGTKGAHTPCHFDTYGSNLVAQLYGRKRWCLFPPSETKNLQPTRVPYEESSVYSNLNFFCGCSDVSAVKEVYLVDLEPGDVLFVPFHWWHYVENLSSAISVNIWIPHELDDVSRTDESLVKYFMTSVCKSLSAEDTRCILNPNEDDLPTFEETNNLQELSWCLNQHEEIENKQSCNKSLNKYRVDKTSPEKLREYLKCKCRDNYGSEISGNSNGFRSDVINAFCDPEIISLVRKKLCKSRSHNRYVL